MVRHCLPNPYVSKVVRHSMVDSRHSMVDSIVIQVDSMTIQVDSRHSMLDSRPLMGDRQNNKGVGGEWRGVISKER